MEKKKKTTTSRKKTTTTKTTAKKPAAKKTTTKKIVTKKENIEVKQPVKEEKVISGKIREAEAEKSGAVIAAVVMVVLSFIYFTLGIIIQGDTNYGWYSIIALYCVVVFGYKGIKLHKKLDIVTAIIWLLMFIITTIGYIINLIDTSAIL